MPNKKIYTNTLAQIAGKITTAIIAIFLIKILSVYLGLDGRGIYDKIYNYLSFFAVIADLGLYTITVRELSKNLDNPEEMEKISGNVLSLRTVSGIAIIVLSLAVWFFLPGYNDHTAIIGILIVSFFTLFGLIDSSIRSYLQAILKTEFSFFSQVTGKLITFSLILYSVQFALPASTTSLETRLIAVFLSGLAGNIVMTAMIFFYAKKFQKIRWYWDPLYLEKILVQSIPYWIALFLGAIFLKIDIFLLSVMENPEISNKITALYSLPMKIVEVGMMYGTIFLNSLLPVLTSAIEQKRTEDAKNLSTKWFELLMGFGAGISVFLAFFSSQIIAFIGSEEFLTKIHGHNSADVLGIVAWIFLTYFIASLANYILIAAGFQKKIIYTNLIVAIINLIWNLIVIPHFSFMGSAIVTIFSQLILVAMSFYFSRAYLDFKNIFIKFVFFIATSAFSGFMAKILGNAILNIVHTDSLFVSLTIFGVIFSIFYLGFWFLFRKLSKKFL